MPYETKNEGGGEINDCIKGKELYWENGTDMFCRTLQLGELAQHLFSVAVRWAGTALVQCCGKSKETFCSRLYLNTLHGNTCIILCICSTFRRSTVPNSISIQRQYLKFLRQFLRCWDPHNLRSLTMVTVFVWRAVRMTETFASPRPDCLFFCSRILEEDAFRSLVLFPLSVF